MTEAVELQAYDPEWAISFAIERDVVAACFSPPARLVEHMGSTSVPGLSAKPVIDMLALVAAREEGEAAVPALEMSGYRNVPNYPDPYRMVLIKRRPDGTRSHHLHIHTDTDEVRRHLIFRDVLRAECDIREAYEALKHDLAARFHEDRAAYSKHKTAFIDEVVLSRGGPARRTAWNP